MATGHRASPLLFVHIMKTAGTTLLTQLRAVFPAEATWPADSRGARPGSPEHWRAQREYASVAPLAACSPERRGSLVLVAGHLPHAVVDLLAEASPPRTVDVVTLVRDPVARTLSFLAQVQRDQPLTADRSLEAIYEDPWFFDRFVRDHQVRVLSMTLAEAQAPRTDQQLLVRMLDEILPSTVTAGERRHLDDLIGGHDSPTDVLVQLAHAVEELGIDPAVGKASYARLQARPDVQVPEAGLPFLFMDASMTRPSPVDRTRLIEAQHHLATCAVVGLTEDYDGFVADLNRRLDLDCPPGGRRNSGGASYRGQVSAAFEARIRRDNALDLELYEFTRDLLADRRRRG